MAAEAAAVASFICSSLQVGMDVHAYFASTMIQSTEQDPQVIKDKAVAALKLKFSSMYIADIPK